MKIGIGLFASLTFFSFAAQAQPWGGHGGGHGGHGGQDALVVDQSTDSTTGACPRRPSGTCNLRAAVAAAVSRGGADIELRVDSAITQGEIVIAGAGNPNVEIRSANGRKSITNTGTSRLFTIQSGANVQLDGVNVSGFVAFDGGAIVNHGDLTLTNAAFSANKANCSGSGAMTAFATCGSGAIANDGTLTLGDELLFDANEAKASAWTASFTNASASAGAIGSSGTLVFDGSVTFQNNRVIAEASSGVHPMPAGGATAVASGGAISSTGSLTFTDRARGDCAFLSNGASSTASTPYGTAAATSFGGAVWSSKDVPALSACLFGGNFAGTAGSDVYAQPAP